MIGEPEDGPREGISLHHGALSPAFGRATHDNCEREQIHLAGSIQPHGALLVVREPDLIVLRASDNLGDLLPGASAAWLGRSLDQLDPELADAVRRNLGEHLDKIPLAVCCGRDGKPVDLVLHRAPSGGLVVEIEPAGPVLDLAGPVERALKSVVSSASLTPLCDETVRIFRELTGYDRVMVYRFDEEGHGAVIAEHRRADLEAFLGNRYPATDIPHIARRLYERNRVRAIVDVHYTPVPISAVSGDMAAFDMSLCALRSPSPIHVQYLKNMGVNATLVISLMVSGRLWGLISCHHDAPYAMPYGSRAVCELLAEAVATRIAALESFVQSQVELSVRRIEQRIIESISREGDWRVSLFDGSNSLLTPLGASGAALLFEGQCLTVGDVPSTQRLREIGQWLDEQARCGVPHSPIFATTALSVDAPRFLSIADVASGLLAATVSSTEGEYLIWFRPEQVRTETWGGDPAHAYLVSPDGAELSPRRSFAQWRQRVEGTSVAWSAAELTAARLIGETVTDVVLQFRSVRMLIAQNQLEQVSQQVGCSELPVIIADETGGILLVNRAFADLLAPQYGTPVHFEDLPALFHEPADIARRLNDLRLSRRTWRGEVLLRGAAVPRAMLVRADPVFSSPDRVLGFVLLFTDLTERKQAETARKLFQEGIVHSQRIAASHLESRAGLAAQSLLASILENAQLAALEITDGVDTAGMAGRLESVRASVQRASEMLERLIRHSGQKP